MLVNIGGSKTLLNAIKEYIRKRISKIKRPDWNQNDENAQDYIKNRTHWISHKWIDCTYFNIRDNYDTISKVMIEGSEYEVIRQGSSLHVPNKYVISLNGRDASVYINKKLEDGSWDRIYSGCKVLVDIYHPLNRRFLPNSNIINGSSEGSTRTVASKSETDDYIMGYASHAEGRYTEASGYISHAEGDYTKASGYASHAEGDCTEASGYASHAEGRYNIADTSDSLAHIVGNGTWQKRSNAHTLDWKGNAWFAGDVYVGSNSGTNKDGGSEKLATEQYVNDEISELASEIRTIDDGWGLIFKDEIPEDAASYVRNTDYNGENFHLKEAFVIVYTKAFEESTNNSGRAIGFLDNSLWGHGGFGISNSLATGVGVARYDMMHVKVIQGYQVQMGRWASQNSTNAKGIMVLQAQAGNAPFNFDSADDVAFDDIGKPKAPQGYISTVKIFGYSSPLVSAGSVVILYGVRHNDPLPPM